MNKELFFHMQSQLTPSPEAEEALKARLAAAPAGKRVPWGRYAAVAACVALVAAAFPVYNALNPTLHPYTVGPAAAIQDLAEKIDLGGDWGAQAGSGPSTGDLPGGAYVEGDVQEEAARAYEALTAHFQDGCPPWYGGAYIDEYGGLVVCVVDAPVDDKSLYLDIQDMAQSDRVAFRDVTYSLERLNALQERVTALLGEVDLDGAFWSSAVDEENNQVAVALPFADKKALAGLHKLDPAGDAIAVTVAEGQTAIQDLKATVQAATHAVAPAPVGDSAEPESPLAEEPALVEPAGPNDGAHYDLLELPVPEGGDIDG